MDGLSHTWIKNIDLLTLDRLLRRESIDRGVRILKVAIVIACLLLLGLAVRSIISSLLANATAISELKNDIHARLLAVPETQVTKAENPNYTRIADDNIFGSIGVKETKASQQPAPLPVSRSTLSLIGTYVAGGESSYAIIDNKKSQDVFGIGESVFGEAKLRAVYTDRVEIERDGQVEVLKLDDTPEGGGSSEAGADSIVVDERELDRALENLPLLLTQARAVPYFKDGQSVGLRLFAIKSGSLFEKIGLMNGDVLKAVNGASLGDITQAVKLFEKLKEQKSITVNLERGREEKVLKYQIR